MLFKCLYFYYGLHLWIIGIYSKLARKTFTVLEKIRVWYQHVF